MAVCCCYYHRLPRQPTLSVKSFPETAANFSEIKTPTFLSIRFDWLLKSKLIRRPRVLEAFSFFKTDKVLIQNRVGDLDEIAPLEVFPPALTRVRNVLSS